MDNKFQKYYQILWEKNRKKYPRYTDIAISNTTQKEIDLWGELPELEKNFFEFLNDEPFTDIKIHDLSIKDFFDIWEKDMIDPIINQIKLALTHLVYYKNLPTDMMTCNTREIILNSHKDWMYL